MLNAMRRAPIPECIDRAQLARELLAQQFEGELGHTTRYRAEGIMASRSCEPPKGRTHGRVSPNERSISKCHNASTKIFNRVLRFTSGTPFT